MVAGGWGGGVGGHKAQTSRYNINVFWDVMYSLVTVVNNIVLYI